MDPASLETVLLGEELLPVVDVTLRWLDLDSGSLFIFFKEFDLDDGLGIESLDVVTLFGVGDSVGFDSKSDMLSSRGTFLIVINYIVSFIFALSETPLLGKSVVFDVLLDVVVDHTWLDSL